MKNEKVVFYKSQYDSDGCYNGQKKLSGIILDKYRDVSDNAGGCYPCDYYLIEGNDGTLYSVRPHEIVKRLFVNHGQEVESGFPV